MRIVKLLSVAAAMAVVATALIGVGSASGTTLCKELAEICPEGARYPAGTVIEAKLRKGTVAKLETSVGTVTCAQSSTVGETAEESGAPLDGTLTTLIFGECKLGSTACTVTVQNLPYLMQGEEIEPGNGTLVTSNGGSGEPQANVKCGAFINCNYTQKELTLNGEGGSPAILRVEKVELTRLGGFICPKGAVANAEYEVTNPMPLFASAKP